MQSLLSGSTTPCVQASKTRRNAHSFWTKLKSANLSLNSALMSVIFSEREEKSILFPSPSNLQHDGK